MLVLAAAIGFWRLPPQSRTSSSPRPFRCMSFEVQSPNASSSGGEEVILTATGYIIAAHKIEVASKVNGRVASISVDKGEQS